ncbi:MAG: mercury methylation corrinoid protein HgcA [Treponemataceae bacterium]|nr:mercury methylation corrinoid protein HgcA [Treponemataceae bacterium]
MNHNLQGALFTPLSEVKKRNIPVVSSQLTMRDKWGGIKVRWGFGRSKYVVTPGLYACGNPTSTSVVLVTANYKLSFDTLRKELAGIDAWILVLDTKGINVWCAAGKGTFGTTELIYRIGAVGLASLVSHRVLILPQLGAPGVAAHEVTKATGFRVIYGPVRAKDIPAFLAAGMQKTDAMCRVEFRLSDRLAVAPVELVHAWPFALVALVLSFLFSGFSGGITAASVIRYAVLFASPLFVGAVLFPVLLPFLPFKAFALKGAVVGLLWSFFVISTFGLGIMDGIAYILIATSLISFISMNFTGSSTFTNLSGAMLEVKIGLPIMIATALLGVVVIAFRLGLNA